MDDLREIFEKKDAASMQAEQLKPEIVIMRSIEQMALLHFMGPILTSPNRVENKWMSPN